jgi:hypothetical protein
MKAYIDSDVLTWHLRGECKALNLLKRLRDKGHYDLCIGAMNRAESVFSCGRLKSRPHFYSYRSFKLHR